MKAMKIMASDFDGTLRRYDAPRPYVRKDDMEAITAFKDAGNLFGMCSGRALQSILKESAGMPLSDFYIVSSGAVIAESICGRIQILKEYEIDRKIAEAICSAHGDHKVFYVHLDGKLYRVGSTYEGEQAQIFVKTFEDLPEGRIEGVSIGTDSVKTAGKITRQLLKRYDGKLGVFQNNDYLDCVAYGCSKASGIQYLREIYPGHLIGGIGDSFNDIPLLDEADVSFTFDFSPEEVRAHADYIVTSEAEALYILKSL